MDKKKFKKLKTEELLEIMLQQQKTIEEQARKIEELEHSLAEKNLKIDKSGSIAEAALALNDIFEKAQAAADQYLLNIKSNQEAQEDKKDV
ncbi:DNA repair protein [Streptococcus didelphis]|uniref:hypothetical protein n=1 Tax=Streptococcus didelphis TaxID=102886 RepID=UPI00037C1CC0|nr:hypothetical protein [Streptococcus didelphis]